MNNKNPYQEHSKKWVTPEIKVKSLMLFLHIGSDMTRHVLIFKKPRNVQNEHVSGLWEAKHTGTKLYPNK